MGEVIKFPQERTKRFMEEYQRLKEATSWWPSKAEQAREAHRAAMKLLPRQEKSDETPPDA